MLDAHHYDRLDALLAALLARLAEDVIDPAEQRANDIAPLSH